MATPKDINTKPVNTLGEAVFLARKKAGLTQQALARAADVTQVTISRLEQNMAVRPKVMRKVLEILRDHLPSLQEKKETITAATVVKRTLQKSYSRKLWDLSIFQYSPSGISGDLIAIREAGRDHLHFMVCDATSTGPDANVMAVALEFGFHAVAGAIAPAFFSPDAVRQAIEGAYRRTGERWMGPPSVLFGTLDDTMGYADIINLGLPAPIYKKTKKETTPIEESGLGALGLPQNPKTSKSAKVLMSVGDILLCCSDGFVENFQKINRETLLSRLNDAGRYLSDSRSILLNLIQSKRDQNVESFVSDAQDDMCALVIVRKKNGR